jgi:CRISPR-associated exonuclease Cas4
MRDREVEFTTQLKDVTENAVSELHKLLTGGTTPPAVFKPACEECSLYPICCLPEITSRSSRVAQAAAQELFEIR